MVSGDGQIRDQRVWSVAECAEIFRRSVTELKQQLAKATITTSEATASNENCGDGPAAMLSWDKVRLTLGSHHTPFSLLSAHTHTHTHPFNGPLSGTTRISQYQKGKTNLDFTEARDIECQWHQLGHMQVCTSLQTDNHASTPPLSFYRPDALPATQPTVSMH